MKALKVRSHAKINLFLDILKKRDDGYHDIRTIFSEIELSDKISFTLTKKDNVSILTNKYFVSTKDNLIYKVALFIKDRYNVASGAAIELEKNIPVAAGLGGGSSNCAATIKALSRLWDLALSPEEMHEIAAHFGSDINFFLEGGCKLGTGRGEILSDLPAMDIDHIFLVNPGFPVSSGEAYKALKLADKPNENWRKLLQTSDLKYCFNALQSAVCQRYPELAEIIYYLESHGATKTILSGSGATVIAFCPDDKTANKFADFYRKKNYWNYITKTKRSTK
ncbi:MAG: 4-(cytidine 5'-diphospho)-2-C-methyl-D-erythritol kinase [Candidatus Cloacimonadales bacterium]